MISGSMVMTMRLTMTIIVMLYGNGNEIDSLVKLANIVSGDIRCVEDEKRKGSSL